MPGVHVRTFSEFGWIEREKEPNLTVPGSYWLCCKKNIYKFTFKPHRTLRNQKNFEYGRELMKVVRRIIKATPRQGQQFCTHHLLVTYNQSSWTRQDKMFAMLKFRDREDTAPHPLAFILTIKLNPTSLEKSNDWENDDSTRENSCSSVENSQENSVNFPTLEKQKTGERSSANFGDKTPEKSENSMNFNEKSDKFRENVNGKLSRSEKSEEISSNSKEKSENYCENVNEKLKISENSREIPSNSHGKSEKLKIVGGNSTRRVGKSGNTKEKHGKLEEKSVNSGGKSGNSDDFPEPDVQETVDMPYQYLIEREIEKSRAKKLKNEKNRSPPGNRKNDSRSTNSPKSANITDLVMEGLMFTIRQDEDSVTVVEQKTKLEPDEVLENSEKIETQDGKALVNSSLLKLENLITKIDGSSKKSQNTTVFPEFSPIFPGNSLEKSGKYEKIPENRPIPVEKPWRFIDKVEMQGNFAENRRNFLEKHGKFSENRRNSGEKRERSPENSKNLSIGSTQVRQTLDQVLPGKILPEFHEFRKNRIPEEKRRKIDDLGNKTVSPNTPYTFSQETRLENSFSLSQAPQNDFHRRIPEEFSRDENSTKKSLKNGLPMENSLLTEKIIGSTNGIEFQLRNSRNSGKINGKLQKNEIPAETSFSSNSPNVPLGSKVILGASHEEFHLGIPVNSPKTSETYKKPQKTPFSLRKSSFPNKTPTLTSSNVPTSSTSSFQTPHKEFPQNSSKIDEKTVKNRFSGGKLNSDQKSTFLSTEPVPINIPKVPQVEFHQKIPRNSSKKSKIMENSIEKCDSTKIQKLIPVNVEVENSSVIPNESRANIPRIVSNEPVNLDLSMLRTRSRRNSDFDVPGMDEELDEGPQVDLLKLCADITYGARVVVQRLDMRSISRSKGLIKTNSGFS